MGWENLSLVAYEVIHESVTGFKVYRQHQQVGTIEKRDDLWIAAFMTGFKVITFQHESFEFCFNKLSKLI